MSLSFSLNTLRTSWGFSLGAEDTTSAHLRKHIYTHSQIRSSVPLLLVCPRPTLCLCSKGFKAAVAQRRGRERRREQGLRGGHGQRSVAVGESQSGAYHCLSVIHHDRDKERLSEWEGKGKTKEWMTEEEEKRKISRQEVSAGAAPFGLASQSRHWKGASLY